MRNCRRRITPQQSEGPGSRLEIPPGMLNHRPYIFSGNLTLFKVRAIMLQVRRAAGETSRRTAKVRKDGWGVPLSPI